MTFSKMRIYLPLLPLLIAPPALVLAQARPCADRQVDVSVFGGLTATNTGLDGGRNQSFTPAIDFDFQQVHNVAPSLEIRGTHPLSSGEIVGEHSVLGGFRLARTFRGIYTYGDILAGRGELEYQRSGYHVASNNYIYYQTYSNLLSFGAGINVTLTRGVALRLDAQLENWDTPVTNSGHMTSIPVTIGVVYHLPYLKHGDPYP